MTSSAEGAGIAGCIDDAWKALIFVRRKAAELGVDPDRIVLHGQSAGGHLALAIAAGPCACASLECDI